MKNQPEQTEAPHSQPEDGAARATINGVDIPIHIMPNGDTAGARGAAIEALSFARKGGLL